MTDTATENASEDALDPPAAEAAVTKIPYATVTAGWLNLFAPLVVVSLALSVIAIVVAINADETTVVQGGGGGGGEAAATALTAGMGEFFFEFDSSTIAADTDVAVTMDNIGSTVHNMVVLNAGVNPDSGANINEGMILTQFDDVEPGASLTGTLNLPPAEYLVVCLISGHFDAGMRAPLTVAAA